MTGLLWAICLNLLALNIFVLIGFGRAMRDDRWAEHVIDALRQINEKHDDLKDRLDKLQGGVD